MITCGNEDCMVDRDKGVGYVLTFMDSERSTPKT